MGGAGLVGWGRVEERFGQPAPDWAGSLVDVIATSHYGCSGVTASGFLYIEIILH